MFYSGILVTFGLILFLWLTILFKLQYNLYRRGADSARYQGIFEVPTEAGTEARPRVLLGSHRGYGKEGRPAENTAEAFDAAIKAGVACLETDVIMSGDGVPIIAHGPTAELAGRPDLKLGKLSLAQLRELNFAHYNEGEAFARLLTLEEFLERYSGQDIILNIELKMWTIFSRRFERQVAAILDPYLEAGARIFLSSFNPFSLLKMRRYLPRVCLGMLWRDDLKWFADNRSLFYFVRPDFIHPYEKWVTPELIRYARSQNYRVHTWVVNDRKRMEELTALGIDMAITDLVEAGVSWVGNTRGDDVVRGEEIA